MRATKILVTTIVAAMVFTGFFAVFAAAEGTSFDDAKVIGQGTYSGMVTNDYYYKVNVPAYKAILVTLTAGSNSDVGLTMYDSNKQEVGLGAMASNGERDTAFYDGKSTVQYTIYLKISNLNLVPSNYTINVKFTPGDVREGAKELTDGQSASGTLLDLNEVNWYKISVPKGKLLNVTFTSNGGEIMVTLYDSSGQSIDYSEGTSGYVTTKLLGQTGIIYIEVTPAVTLNNVNITYTITPHLKSGSSEVQQVSNGISAMCWTGVIIGIVIIILIIVLIVKIAKKKKAPKQ